jgi:phosphoglycolate phosphatase-like HAD superfamily hydrolase
VLAIAAGVEEMVKVVRLRHPGPSPVRFLTPSRLRLVPDLPVDRSTRPSAILFDLDGTLVDTMGGYADLAAEIVADQYGLARRNARHLYLQTSGVPFFQQLDAIFGDLPENTACAEEFESRKADLALQARMDDATAATLETLRGLGFRLVVSSSGMQDHVERFAARSPGLFELALGFGVGLSKGEAHVATVCSELALDREELLFVGDSLRDGELAAAAGLGFVAKVGTFTRRDFSCRFPDASIIDAVDEILDIL